MAVETSVILRAILIQIKKAKTVDEAYESVKALCSKEDIDSVEAFLNGLDKQSTD